MNILFTKRAISFICSLLIITYTLSQPTWTAVTNQAPLRSGGGLTLLSDGSVLCKTFTGFDAIGNMWMKLTPDVNGSYVNGTWSLITPMNDSRLYFSSQLLKDGRLYIAGGEYGTGANTSEIYDPVKNVWTKLPSTGAVIGDANSAILDDGRVLQGFIIPSDKALLFDPSTNTYSNAPSSIHSQSESTFIKLKDNSILFVDFSSTTSERYIPSLNQWVADANVPVNLYDSWGGETGPAILLPDGRALFLGSTGNTAIYTPSGNNSPGAWVTGPTIPSNKGCPDTPAAMMADGKIIFTAASSPTSLASVFLAPTYFFEYDYIANTFTQVPSFTGGQTIADTAFNTTMIDLPDGNVLITEANTFNYYIHHPAGFPLAAGKPTITSVAQNPCTNTFTLTGLLFNGISEGASFGDDWQMNTNYPIVKLQSGTNVYYARTHHWNHTGVQRGNSADTTLFDLPGNIPNGTYSLYVSANGISSNPITFTFTPFPALISPLIPPGICTGNTFTYNAVANLTNTTIQWTRPAVPGISNPAILTPQSANPNEVLTNTTTVPLSVVYNYTLSNGSCVSYYYVSVPVNTSPPLTINGNTLFCQGKTTTLTVQALTTYTWSNLATTKSIIVTPNANTVYSVSGTNYYGCPSSKQITVTVKPLPSFTISGNTTICIGDSTILIANGNANSYLWNNSIGDYSVNAKPNSTTTYTILAYGSNGCNKTDSIKINVQNCTLVKENKFIDNNITVYPNPASETLTIIDQNTQGKDVNFQIYNNTGVLLKTGLIKHAESNKLDQIVIKDLPSGIYFLEIKNGENKSIMKFIKE